MAILHADKKFQKFEDVTPELLQKEGVKLLLCDLDNTLRLHSEKIPAAELTEWIQKCHAADIKVVVVSNNGRKKFIQNFCRPLGIPCVWWAKKPMSTKLNEVMAKYKFQPSETVMLGDKWSTDVLAARFAKVRAWKVDHRRDVF